MPEYCPKCKNEILPYMKTGEVKKRAIYTN